MGHPTCSTCPFCDEKNHPVESRGWCRVDPPHPRLATWPIVKTEIDWCGKHPEVDPWSLIQRTAKEIRGRIPQSPEDAPTHERLVDLWLEVSSLHRHTVSVKWMEKGVQIEPGSAGRAWIVVWEKIDRILDMMEEEINFAGAWDRLQNPEGNDPATPESDGA